jgi:tetratricopeptide (TPR) repeat protein
VARSGASVSRSGAPLRTVPPEASSKLPLILGGGAALVIAAAVGIFLALRQPSKPAAEGDPMAAVLVATNLQNARQSLDYKNFSAAINSARQVLKIDASNSEAQQILSKAEATLQQLDGAAEQAKLAVQAGNYEKAAEALALAMQIDPNHKVVAELSRQLDSTFKGKADEARQSMRAAKAAAERARAGSLQSFSDAAALSGEGDGLLKAGQYTQATQKFVEAQHQFDRARRAAEERAAPPPPPVTVAQVTLPPTTLAPPPPPTTLAPPPPPPPTTLPPTTTLPAVVNDEPAVRRVIGDYKRALENRDLGLFKSVKPNTSPDDEKKLRDSFGNIRSWEVAIDIDSVQIQGDRAVVKVSRRDTVNGQRTQPQTQTFTLVKSGSAWTIRDIGRN